MPTRKKTLRRLPEFTRKYYRLTDELESVLNRLKNLREDIEHLELCARALDVINKSAQSEAVE